MKSKPVTAAVAANLVSIEVNDIRMDGGTQTRAEIDVAVVSEYGESMRSGANFPAPVVFFDGTDKWLADGFHRIEAAKAIGRRCISCDVRQGDRRAAILFSVGANASHGLRRSNADKVRAVRVLLGDDEWSKKSDRWIAEKCGVSHTFVAKLRGESDGNRCHQRETKDGKRRNVQRQRREEPPPESGPTEADLDENIEPVLIVGDDPKPIPREREESRSWGNFELSSSISQIVGACHDCREIVERAFAEADPRFVAELRTRTQAHIIDLMQRLDALLPPDGRKADANRSRFGVIAGGKS